MAEGVASGPPTRRHTSLPRVENRPSTSSSTKSASPTPPASGPDPARLDLRTLLTTFFVLAITNGKPYKSRRTKMRKRCCRPFLRKRKIFSKKFWYTPPEGGNIGKKGMEPRHGEGGLHQVPTTRRPVCGQASFRVGGGGAWVDGGSFYEMSRPRRSVNRSETCPRQFRVNLGAFIFAPSFHTMSCKILVELYVGRADLFSLPPRPPTLHVPTNISLHIGIFIQKHKVSTISG